MCYIKLPTYRFDSDNFYIMGSETFYDKVVCLFEYTGIIRQALIKYKFHHKPSFFRAFSLLLAESIKKMTDYRKFDILLDVPLHKEKEHSRGYNQASIIAEMLASELGLCYRSGLLVRVRNTKSQSLLNREQRNVNLKDAFKVINPKEIINKEILIIDDIFTTGNTLNECSRSLKLAGAKKVTAAVIASGRKAENREQRIENREQRTENRDQKI